MSNRHYGPQYSHNSKKSFGGGEKTTFQYVASQDDYVPKAFRLAYRSNFGGFSRQYFNIQSATSSVKDLVEVFKRQFKEYVHDMEEQQRKSSEDVNYKFSAENIVRMLNLQVEEREQAEGNLVFKLGGYKRFYTIDNHTLESLPYVIKEIEAMLRDDGSSAFKLTKYFNRDEIAISFPTEMALPFLYTFDVPTVLRFTGKASIRVHPEMSTGTQLVLPETVDSEGELQFLFSYKIQGQFGFIMPCDHQHYVAGYEKNGQLHLPIRHKFNVDIKKRLIQLQIGVQDPSIDRRLIYYYSKPYVANYDILELKPPISKQVGALPQINFKTEFGHKSTGMIFRFDYAGEDKFLDHHYLYEQIERHNYAGIIALWEDQNMANREVSFYYAGNASPNNQFKLSVMCYTNYYHVKDNPNKQEMKDEALYDAPDLHEERVKVYSEQASIGVANAKVFVLDIDANFEGSKPVQYRSTAFYCRSKVDYISRAVLYMHKRSKNSKVENYRIFVHFENQIPFISGMDPEKALDSDSSYKSQIRFMFGEDYDSSVKINGELKLTKTDRRIKYLKESELHRQCQIEMQAGNKQLYACAKITKEAKYPDSISLQLVQEKQEHEAHNLMEAIYDWLHRHHFVGLEDDDNSSYNRKPGELIVQVDFSPDYNELNATIKTQEHGSRKHISFYDLKEPEENPLNYWMTSLLPHLKYYSRKYLSTYFYYYIYFMVNYSILRRRQVGGAHF